jgi:hypothetical protein
MSSKQTFDSVTRSIRAAEADARIAIASADAVINQGARKNRRALTVTSEKVIFDKLSACLQTTNQLHDTVVAHSHLVAENIASRSRASVLNIRDSILETANRLLELCAPVNPGDPISSATYNPANAFFKITTALQRDGLLEDEPTQTQFAMSAQQTLYVISYRLAQMTLSIIVSVECKSSAKTVLDTGGEVVVSVWEDRLPPVWDTSYHDAAGTSIQLGKRRNLGHWTKQTDAALIDYFSSVVSKSVAVRNDSTAPHVAQTFGDKTNRYNTFLGRPAKQGSEKFDFQTQAQILQGAIDSMSIGEQGELVLRCNPQVINKATMARYILQIIQNNSADDLGGGVRFNKAGYYEVTFPSNAMLGSKVSLALEGKW